MHGARRYLVCKRLVEAVGNVAVGMEEVVCKRWCVMSTCSKAELLE